MKTTVLILVSVVILTSFWPMDSVKAATLVVDANGGGDFMKIQDAIDAAWDFDTIMVRPGIYSEHINYHGSMVTVTGTDPNDPNIVESTIINGIGTGNVVMFRNSEGPFSVIQGLTICNGQNGIECTGADTAPLITKCRVVSNASAGIACSLASPTITETTIENNKTVGISGSFGEISLCRICGNGSGANGHAGLASCRGLARECVISGNNGDGVYNHAGYVKNCIISANSKNGLYFRTSCGCSITNCTVVGNGADGIWFWSYETYWGAEFTIANSIIVLNGNCATYANSSWWNIHIDYSDIWGNRAGDYYGWTPRSIEIRLNNISEDPLFAKRGYWDDSMVWHEGDYHLKSKLGRWDTRTATWVNDPADSPCMDRGDPISPLGEELLPNGGRVNMGAYGGTSQASMSGGPKPLCIQFPEMDFNRDCKVDFMDLALFMNHWLECNLDPQDSCI